MGKKRVTRCFQFAALTWLLIFCLLSGPALARDRLSVRDYIHQKWTAERGAPQGIQALAHEPGGFLWIGADSGLYRFDGVAFERMPSLRAESVNEGAVSALLAASNGDLWIGYQSGRIAIRRKDRLIDVTPPQSEIWIWSFLEDQKAGIWATTGTRGANVFRYSHGKWASFDRKWKIDNGTREFAMASDGSLWFRDQNGVHIFSENGEQLRDVAKIDARLHPAQSGLAEDSGGNMWFSSASAGTFRWPATASTVQFSLQRKVIRAQTPPTSDRQIRFDGDGNLWGRTSNAGVIYIAAPQDIDAGRLSFEERFTQADGLSSDSANALLVDGLGNIWVGTSAGLDRFSRPKIRPAGTIPPRSQYGYAVVLADKALYALDDDSLYRIDSRSDITRLKSGLVNAMALCQLPDQSIWLSTFGGVFRLAGGKFSPGPEPADRRPIMDCATSNDGQLWTSPTDGGLRRYDGRTWAEGPFRGAGNMLVAPILAAPEGGLLGHSPKKGLFHINIDGARQISNLSDIPSRSITAFLRLGDTILIAAPPYLARYEKGRFTVLRQDHGWLRGVTGMVDGPDGNLWLIGRSGIARVSLKDIDRAFADPRHRLEARLYGAIDGLRGSALQGASHNGAARSPDGALWFVTSESIVNVDPLQLASAPAPPVRITRLYFADRIVRDPLSAILPPGTSRIEINFTALDLSDPSNLRFRYQLEGIDNDWIDAGGQRQAIYTNLGPGTYRFRVIAKNSDGIWNRQGATLGFTIRPTFLQSWTFKLLCAVLILILGFAAYALRLRQVTRRLLRSFEDRVAERERIARDLHDTLLQSFHGLILHFQVAADGMPRKQRADGAIDQALQRADTVLAESRDRVYELRVDFGRGDLVKTLSATAEALAITSDAVFSVTVEGTPRALHPVVSDEVGLIGEEAIRNAFRHAGATKIEAVISYDRRGLQLLVRDNGGGLPADVVDAGERPGHFGLTGMTERASRIDGVLKIASVPGGGTEVILNLPARAAYERPPFQRRWMRFFAPKTKE